MTHKKITVHIEDEDILELIPKYLDRLHCELGKLQDAIPTRDYETLRDIGHKIKGSGGGYGFDYISEIGRKLEGFAKAQDLSAVETRNLTM